MGTITIEYLFRTEGGNKESYPVIIDSETGHSIGQEKDAELPAWTKLENQQCENCPLNSSEFPACPVAKDMYKVIESTKDSLSYEKIDIMVKTLERSYFLKQDVQTGLFSLIGLVMASSSCPHFNFLKPLARFHLPFSSIEETHFRILGSFLLEQFFKKEAGLAHSFQLDQVIKNYDELIIVNKGLLERIRAISSKDATSNAFAVLNIFAQLFSSQMKPNFDSIKSLYNIKKPE